MGDPPGQNSQSWTPRLTETRRTIIGMSVSRDGELAVTIRSERIAADRCI